MNCKARRDIQGENRADCRTTRGVLIDFKLWTSDIKRLSSCWWLMTGLSMWSSATCQQQPDTLSNQSSTLDTLILFKTMRKLVYKSLVLVTCYPLIDWLFWFWMCLFVAVVCLFVSKHTNVCVRARVFQLWGAIDWSEMNRKQQTGSLYQLTGSLFSNSIWIQFQKSERTFFSWKFEHKSLELHFLFRLYKVTDCLFYPAAAVYSRVQGQNVPMPSHCCLFIYWHPSTVVRSLGRLAPRVGLLTLGRETRVSILVSTLKKKNNLSFKVKLWQREKRKERRKKITHGLIRTESSGWRRKPVRGAWECRDSHIWKISNWQIKKKQTNKKNLSAKFTTMTLL